MSILKYSGLKVVKAEKKIRYVVKGICLALMRGYLTIKSTLHPQKKFTLNFLS